MIKVEDVEVWGFKHAITGLRAPYRSYEKSDSYFDNNKNQIVIGNEDMALMQRLFKGGPEHRKFMRQIFVSMTITAPLYWWKQFDKYQIGVTTDSESTMHTLAKQPLSFDDFSFDGNFELKTNLINHPHFKGSDLANVFIMECERVRGLYAEEEDPVLKSKLWKLLIQLLPEGYNQTRIVTMNYEVAATIIHQRAGHRLSEWQDFIDELRNLPHLQMIIGERIA